mgnify:CR=1 FL=1
MARYLSLHPEDPQPRLIAQAASALRDGGVIAVPTDSCYALACALGDKDALERIRHLRGVDDRHHLTLMCRDLSEIANYARVDNVQYRLLKAATPGSYEMAQSGGEFVEQDADPPPVADDRGVDRRHHGFGGHAVFDHRVDQVLLGAERPKDGALGDAGGFGHRLQIVENANDLRVDAVYHLHGGRIEADLPRQIHGVADPDGL